MYVSERYIEKDTELHVINGKLHLFISSRTLKKTNEENFFHHLVLRIKTNRIGNMITNPSYLEKCLPALLETGLAAPEEVAGDGIGEYRVPTE